jgi:hypothetical protein
MKFSGNDAQAGWYESPDDSNLEKYWNGDAWTDQSRPASLPEKSLGKFLFRNPLMSDWAFITYLVLLGLTTFSILKQDGALIMSTKFLLLIPMVGITAVWIYIIFLLILVPRRILDKKKGMLKPEVNYVNDGARVDKKKSYIAAGIGVLAILVGFQAIAGSDKSSFSSISDEWFSEEQRISAILSEWNNATLPVMQVIRGLSDGTISESEALLQVTSAQPKVTAIIEKLRVECEGIPREDTSGSDEKAAVAKAWFMLSESCDAIPQQWVETIAIYRAQVDATSTQSDIDYHVSQLNALGERRRLAIINAIQAMKVYANDAQRELLVRMETLLQE